MLLDTYQSLTNRSPINSLKKVLESLNNQLIYGSGSQSTPYLINLVGQKEFIKCQQELIELGLITSSLKYNFATCDVSRETLEGLGLDVEEYIFQAKVLKYTMNGVQDYECNSTGYRPNFIEHSNDLFKLDTDMLEKYQEEIYTNTVAKMIKERAKQLKKKKSTKTIEEFYSELKDEYEGVIREVINTYISNPNALYCLNGTNLDYRKRAIAKGLNKILNPISYKVGRALVTLRESETKVLTLINNKDDIDNVYLFIAEEVGNSSIGKTIEWKIEEGIRCYRENVTSHELHVKIWMERIYKQLDTLMTKGFVKWVTPLECDFSMSMSVVMGLATGHSELLIDTNTVYNAIKVIKDPWNVEGVKRKVSKSLTAGFYGSTESLESLNKGNNATKKEIRLLKKARVKGKFAVLLALGALLKEGSTINTEKYTVNFPEESYEIEVKKTRAIGTIEKRYFTLIDGELKLFVNHDIKYTKDYDRNKLSMFTGFAHHDDSYLLEGSLPDCFALPIHDAIVTSPWGVTESRENARVRMIEMYSNRKERLMSYLKSVGVVDKDNNFTSVTAMQRFEEYKALVTPYEGDFSKDCSGYAMK